MPIYEFLCSHCRAIEEQILKISDDTKIIDCPFCGEKQSSHRIMSKTSFELNGEGWEADGYGYPTSESKAGTAIHKSNGKIRRGKNINPLEKYVGKGMLKK